jgi:hypothetical protein
LQWNEPPRGKTVCQPQAAALVVHFPGKLFEHAISAFP